MRCIIAGPLPADARGMMRHLGYAECHTPGIGITFSRSTHEARFPRFHAHAEDMDDGSIVIRVHLDQESSSGTSSHGYVWAYHNPHLIAEEARYRDIVEKLRQKEASGIRIVAGETATADDKRGLIGKLFRLM